MENLPPQENSGAIIFDNLCIEYLKSTRKWTKFLSLLGFIFILFLIIITLLIGLQFFHGTKNNLISLLPMILLAFIYFFPIYYLRQFSDHSKAAIKHYDTQSLAKAMKYLKLHYTFMGVLVVIMMICYIIAGVGMFAFNGFKPF